MPLNNLVPLIIDILALVVAIIIIAKCASKGFISSVLSFLGGLVSVVVAAVVSKPIAQYVYTTFLQQKVVNQLTSSIGEAATTNTSLLIAGLEESLKSLPSSLVSLLQLDSQSVVNVISNNVGQSAETISTAISQKIIEPLVITLIAAVFFIILFIILSLIFRLLSKAFTKIKKVPVIGTVNTVLGIVFGILYSLVVLYVISVVLNLVLVLFGSSIPYFTQDTLQNSYIFGWLSSFKLSF